MDVTNQVFTPRHVLMDPEFEDLMYGTDLKDGMIVLIEDALIKGDPENMTNDYDKARCLEANRWCTVSRFQSIPRGLDSPLIKFIGVYADGTKIPRTYDSSYCWIVKKNEALDLGDES
jgi:hypothetical protein